MERDPRVENREDAAETKADPSEDQEELMSKTDEKGDQTETDTMHDELEIERQRSAEYLDQAQRARAELVNYRRRTEEELSRMQKLAGERIISKLLPAIDDLDRAVRSMSEEDRASSWGEGIVLVQRKMWSTLESEGVTPIESIGQPFDPSLHEAISMQEGANGATTVVEEYQRGYMLGDRVLRPAMVVVGSASADNASADQTSEHANDQSNSNEEDQ